MNLAAVAFPIVTLGGPLLLGLAGLVKSRRAGAAASAAPAWDWRLTIASALIFALAFNLVFFIQELFLVIPKALTPGLHATLFHNNHDWTGHRPIEKLLQGSGALAILLAGLGFAFWATRRPPRSPTLRLFVVWMAFHGLFMSLAQGVVGAFVPRNDVGMAMDYLRLGPVGETAVAFVALAAVAAAGTWLARPLLGMAATEAELDGAGRRTGFIFRAATLPAFLGVLLVLPFRLPGPLMEVAVVPLAVTVIGIGWIQASAWRVAAARPERGDRPISIAWPLAALVLLLLVFQVLLRPGVQFS